MIRPVRADWVARLAPGSARICDLAAHQHRGAGARIRRQGLASVTLSASTLQPASILTVHSAPSLNMLAKQRAVAATIRPMEYREGRFSG